MPLIQVNIIKDVFTTEQKGEIISKLTDALVGITSRAAAATYAVDQGHVRRPS